MPPPTWIDAGTVAEDVAHDRGVVAAPRGGVEVDDVNALETVAHPAARDIERVVEPHPLVGVRAADELHARAFAQINRRDRDHCAASRRNARTSSTPAAELFSG